MKPSTVLAMHPSLRLTLHASPRRPSAIAGAASQPGSATGGFLSLLREAAKRDPELYVLGGIMVSAFGLAGWYHGRNPTAAGTRGEENINVAAGTMPWQVAGEGGGGGNFKYMYHPGGDSRNAPRRARGALNPVVVPAVTLPKELHERFNKYGKEEYPDY